jgi:hypothetical protein
MPTPQQDENPEIEPPTIEVMPCNWWTVQTYLGCEWTLLPLFDGASLRFLHMGISAAEVLAVLDILGITQEKRRRVLSGIRVMVSAGAEVRNAR